MATKDMLETVARIHAQANKSDPFAYAKMLKDLRNGLEPDPIAVTESAIAIILARGEKVKP